MTNPQLDLVGGLPPAKVTGATFDSTRTYRWALWRTWDQVVGAVNFVMLNPSTADETANDPTVERCERYARAWGYGGLVVTNLFGLVSTDPRALHTHPDPVGSANDRIISHHATRAQLVVVAWGNHGSRLNRGKYVAQLIQTVRPTRPAQCLGHNQGGQPVHPLYQPNDAQLRPYVRGPR